MKKSELKGTEHGRGRNSLIWGGWRECELTGFKADKEIDKGVGMDSGKDREMGSVTNEGIQSKFEHKHGSQSQLTMTFG